MALRGRYSGLLCNLCLKLSHSAFLQPNRYEVLPNGLEGISGGLDRMKNGQVSGTKLVAHPQETK